MPFTIEFTDDDYKAAQDEFQWFTKQCAWDNAYGIRDEQNIIGFHDTRLLMNAIDSAESGRPFTVFHSDEAITNGAWKAQGI